MFFDGGTGVYPIWKTLWKKEPEKQDAFPQKTFRTEAEKIRKIRALFVFSTISTVPITATATKYTVYDVRTRPSDEGGTPEHRLPFRDTPRKISAYI